MIIVVLMAQLVWKLPINDTLFLKLNTSPETELTNNSYKTIVATPT
jgi:hypothetical protein